MRDGHYAVADLMSLGRTMLGRRHVLPSVVHTLKQIQVEGTFPTGTYLVTVHDPIGTIDMEIWIRLFTAASSRYQNRKTSHIRPLKTIGQRQEI